MFINWPFTDFISLVVEFQRSAKIVLVFWEGLPNCLQGKIGLALQAFLQLDCVLGLDKLQMCL